MTNRFFTFTGQALSDNSIAERKERVLAFLEQYMRGSGTGKTPDSANGANIDFDVSVTARSAVNGTKFSALFDEGNTSGYASQSEAEQALCCMLAFYTGGKAESMDSLFRQSKLYREKWERDDYRNATITKAIESCNGQFYHLTKPMPSYVYYDRSSKRMRVSCPMLAKHIRENLRYMFVRDGAKNGVNRYVYQNGFYQLYSDEMLKGVVKKYVTDYDETILRMSDVNEVFQQITTDLVFHSNDELNADEDIINFQNCLHIASNSIDQKHSPDILSTIQIPCSWTGVPNETPVFDNFMYTLMDGNKQIEQLLLEFMGVCLSNIKG